MTPDLTRLAALERELSSRICSNENEQPCADCLTGAERRAVVEALPGLLAEARAAARLRKRLAITERCGPVPCPYETEHELAYVITDLRARLAAEAREIERLRRVLDLKDAALARWTPCPDCRDKVREGECQRCRAQAAEARLAAVERERDAWRDTCSRQEEETGRAHRERDALRVEVERERRVHREAEEELGQRANDAYSKRDAARAALAKYGDHTDDCAYAYKILHHPCTCGLDQARI